MQPMRKLDHVAILKGVPSDELARLAATCRWRSHAKGTEILSAATDSTDVVCLVEGRVRISIVSAGGREVAFRELAPGASFGELAAIDGHGRSVSVVALEECVVAALSRQQFWGLLERQPKVATLVLQNLAALVRDLTTRLVETTTLTAPVRVRIELLRLAREAGVTGNRACIDRFPFHADFANRIGATREAVTRELARLTRAGLLVHQNAGIAIGDVARLEASIDEVSVD